MQVMGPVDTDRGLKLVGELGTLRGCSRESFGIGGPFRGHLALFLILD